jgi:transposase-like protein
VTPHVEDSAECPAAGEIAILEPAEATQSRAHALSRLGRLATAGLVQEALEQEQMDFVGRGRYERGERQGRRNGYVPGHLDTGGAALPLGALRLPAGPLGRRRALAIEMYARGLSTRDVERRSPTRAASVCSRRAP